MKCELCKAEGKRSTVHPGYSVTTAMGVHVYYDEDGKYHRHDPNKTTTKFTCSNGHEFSESSEARSCWCGWK